MDEINKLKKKMDVLVSKWKDKPEPAEKSAEWFRRRGDRMIYSMLDKKLKVLTNGQQSLENVEASEFATVLFEL